MTTETTVSPPISAPRPPVIDERWEDRHTGLGGAINLTKDEYVAVRGLSAADESAMSAWALLAAVVVLPVARHPLITVATLVLASVYVVAGWWAVPVVLTAAVGILIGWRRCHAVSFDGVVASPARSWRARRMYRRRWSSAMDRAGLGCRIDANSRRRYRPRLVRLTLQGDVEQLLVELLPRQTVADVDARLADLAYSFDRAGGWVTVDRPAAKTHAQRVLVCFSRIRSHEPAGNVIYGVPVDIQVDPASDGGHSSGDEAPAAPLLGQVLALPPGEQTGAGGDSR